MQKTHQLATQSKNLTIQSRGSWVVPCRLVAEVYVVRIVFDAFLLQAVRQWHMFTVR